MERAGQQTGGFGAAARGSRVASSPSTSIMKLRLAAILGCLVCAGCSDDTPTSPSTPTVAPPSITETWEGTLAVGGSRFYSFSVGQNGTVNVTLTNLFEKGEDSATQVGLSLGYPAATGCLANTSVTVAAAVNPQVTNTFAPGIYCAKIADAGNLAGPAQFRIVIAHP
jgi:ABC-type glycerol-3-phosphate transport system substrate-binding protein